jgi:hypothetical protein
MEQWPAKLDVTRAEVELWEKSFPYATNTGLLTRDMPVLDTDILGPEAAEAIEMLARSRFEEHGRILVRIGQAPKRAIPFRTNRPFKKLSVNLIAPNGKEEKIELLADGQQVVAFGVHPQTGQPFTWFGGEPGTVTRNELPEIDEPTARQLLDDAAELLVVEHGYRRAAARPKDKGGNGQDAGGAADWAYLVENILAGRELHDSLRDLAAKLVTSGMGKGAAVNFLRGALEKSEAPRDDRWQDRYDNIPRVVESAEHPIIISASPFVWRDPANIPPREWLYARHHIRKYLTCTVGLGGGGKTSLGIVEALAMATGRSLLGITPPNRLRVWIWNGEDPADELNRRVIAAMVEHNIAPGDIAGFLFCNTGRETPIVLATQTRNGTTITKPVVDAVIDTIKRNQLDVLIIDPFVKSHKVSENDNIAIDMVAGQWASIADITNCGIELSHHSRKTGGNEVTIEDSRGAIALINASRSARVLNKMTKQEAENAGVEQAWRYFRLDNGKASMAPPPERAEWYRLATVNLANGDEVGVATAWTWPNAFEGVTPSDLRAAQKEVGQGGPWRANHQAKNWVGIPIAKALRLNPNKDRKRIAALLETWIRNGMFVVVPGKGSDRHPTQFVEVGQWAD